MSNLWLNITVVLFWLASMSWLVVDKVLPSLLLGEPPTYRTILDEPDGDSGALAPVGWDIYSNDRLVGFAASEVRVQPDGVHELESDVQFWALPLEDLSPVRIGALDTLLGGRRQDLRLSAKAVFEIDPLGRLLRFDSSLALGGMAEPIRMEGVVDGNELGLTIRAGELAYRTETYLPPDALVSDALSPTSRLPGLRVGQQWMVPLYSPFHSRARPMEVMHAAVEREEYLPWNGRAVQTLYVAYYSDPGSRLGGSQQPRGKLWVRRDGTVLQQEVLLLNSWLRFVRRPPQPREERPSRGPAVDRGGAIEDRDDASTGPA